MTSLALASSDFSVSVMPSFVRGNCPSGRTTQDLFLKVLHNRSYSLLLCSDIGANTNTVCDSAFFTAEASFMALSSSFRSRASFHVDWRKSLLPVTTGGKVSSSLQNNACSGLSLLIVSGHLLVGRFTTGT